MSAIEQSEARADLCFVNRSLDSCKVDGFAQKPVFLLGASLGGCISVIAIAKKVGLISADPPWSMS